jgi:hypothetical protein
LPLPNLAGGTYNQATIKLSSLKQGVNYHARLDGLSHADFFSNENTSNLALHDFVNQAYLMRENVSAGAAQLTLRIVQP